MTAEKAFWFVVGLIALGLIEGLFRVAFPTFPLVEVFGFQGAIAGGIITTKLINDTKEMKYGCGKNGNGQVKPVA